MSTEQSDESIPAEGNHAESGEGAAGANEPAAEPHDRGGRSEGGTASAAVEAPLLLGRAEAPLDGRPSADGLTWELLSWPRWGFWPKGQVVMGGDAKGARPVLKSENAPSRWRRSRVFANDGFSRVVMPWRSQLVTWILFLASIAVWGALLVCLKGSQRLPVPAAVSGAFTLAGAAVPASFLPTKWKAAAWAKARFSPRLGLLLFAGALGMGALTRYSCLLVHNATAKEIALEDRAGTRLVLPAGHWSLIPRVDPAWSRESITKDPSLGVCPTPFDGVKCPEPHELSLLSAFLREPTLFAPALFGYEARELQCLQPDLELDRAYLASDDVSLRFFDESCKRQELKVRVRPSMLTKLAAGDASAGKSWVELDPWALPDVPGVRPGVKVSAEAILTLLPFRWSLQPEVPPLTCDGMGLFAGDEAWEAPVPDKPQHCSFQGNHGQGEFTVSRGENLTLSPISIVAEGCSGMALTGVGGEDWRPIKLNGGATEGLVVGPPDARTALNVAVEPGSCGEVLLATSALSGETGRPVTITLATTTWVTKSSKSPWKMSRYALGSRANGLARPLDGKDGDATWRQTGGSAVWLPEGAEGRSLFIGGAAAAVQRGVLELKASPGPCPSQRWRESGECCSRGYEGCAAGSHACRCN